jgi:hypothetical protein
MTPPRLLLAILAAAVLTVAVVAVAEARRPEPRVATAQDPVPAASRTEALAVLADWDRRRSAAWAAGDAAALGRLYLDGSDAGRADAAMLRRWAARGLRVTGLRMQVLEATVVSGEADRWEVDVTDRVVGGDAGGQPLPRDGWSTRRIVLERTTGEWQVASVRPRDRR